MKDRVNILGVKVDDTSMDETLARIKSFLESSSAKMVFTPNPEFVMCARQDNDFMNILNSGDLIIPDGIGIIYASKILHGKTIKRVTGFDTVSNLFKLGSDGFITFYILAGTPGVADKARENLTNQYPNLKILGVHNGYFWKDAVEEQEVVDEINSLKPDILFVGMGSPRQEKWIFDNKDSLNIKAALGIGGCFDIFAGNLKSAPGIFKRLSLEWLYRFIQEPTRYKRIFKLFKFGFIVILERLKFRG